MDRDINAIFQLFIFFFWVIFTGMMIVETIRRFREK